MADLALTLSGLVDGTTADQADVSVPLIEARNYINNLKNGVGAFDQLNFGAGTTVSIATGVAAITQTRHRIDTEGAIAADDLDSISGGTSGDMLLIASVNAGRVITVKHATGNLRLPNNADITLNDPNYWLLLVYDGTNWVVPRLAPSQNYVTASQLATYEPRFEEENHYEARASAATVVGVGTAITLNGVPVTYNDSDDKFVEHTTGATVNTPVGWVEATYDQFRFDHNPTLTFVLKTWSNVTSVRLWAMCRAGAGNLLADNPAVASFGFRFSTLAGDSGWMPFVHDGTTFTTGAALNTVTTDQFVRLRVRVDASLNAIYYSLAAGYGAFGVEQVLNSNLPAASTTFSMNVTCINLVAADRRLRFSRAQARFR